MRKDMRMHLIGVSLIVLVGAAALMTSIKVGTPPAAAPTGEGTITVSSATWGGNCIGKPKQPVVQPVSAPPADNDKMAEPAPTVTPEARIETKRDNVLQAMASACDGKSECKVPVEAKSFGGELDTICSPEFRVEYRCYHFGRLLSVSLENGGDAKLSCSEAGSGKDTKAP